MNQDYYTILLRQYTNAISEVDAKRIAGAVAIALDGSLSKTQSKKVFALLPPSARVVSTKFYHRLNKNDSNIEFNLTLLLDRIRILLNLTGNDEARHYLRGYFQAAIPLIDSSAQISLLGILPPQVVNILQD